jgi:hypothetical protein
MDRGRSLNEIREELLECTGKLSRMDWKMRVCGGVSIVMISNK